MMKTRTKILLVLIPVILLTLLALGVARVYWVVIHVHDDRIPQSSWTLKNNIGVPIEIVINDIRTVVIRPNGQDFASFIKPSEEHSKFTIRAYEFIPGEGTLFGWYDAQTDTTFSGSVSSNLVSCKSYSWTDLNPRAPMVSIEPKIEC